MTRTLKVAGFLRKQLNGEYRIILERSNSHTRKRSRRWHEFQGTKQEADAELARLKFALSGHHAMSAEKITVVQFLEKWLAHIKLDVSARTHERYAEIARNNLAPLLGKIPLTKLGPQNITAALQEARANGRVDKSGGLAPQTVRHMYRVLFQAVSQAVRWHMLPLNPLDRVMTPEVRRPLLNVYSFEEAGRLFKVMEDTQIFVPVLLALFLGLRRGEISALRWGDIDFEAKKLSVSHSVQQMNRSWSLIKLQVPRQRSVALPQLVVSALHKYKRQAQRLLSSQGKTLSKDCFVCSLKNGSMMPPSRITHQWIKEVRATDLPIFRFNDLRHSHAVHLMSLGVHVAAVSERLGHSSVGTTAQFYSGAILGPQKDAVSRLDGALREVVAERCC